MASTFSASWNQLSFDFAFTFDPNGIRRDTFIELPEIFLSNELVAIIEHLEVAQRRGCNIDGQKNYTKKHAMQDMLLFLVV